MEHMRSYTEDYVDTTYDTLDQGSRVHMFNKLAKHGYDRRHGKTILKYLSDEQRQELEEALGEEREKPVYSIGSRYLRIPTDVEYIIAAVSSTVSRDRVALINLTTGLRFSDTIEVDDLRGFTQSPFAGYEHEFTKVL